MSSLITHHSSFPAPGKTQICGICRLDLPVANFGVCRARESGRNLYCKPCINKKVAASRLALRSYRHARRERDSQQNLPLIGLAPAQQQQLRDQNGVPVGSSIRNLNLAHHERVLGAIHRGARTQREILSAVRPDTHSHSSKMDQVGESLAILLFGNPRQIKTAVVDGRRVYLPAATPVATAVDEPAPTSLSTLGGITYPLSQGRKGRAA